MNVLVLASGGSDAFQKAGYPYPKNLVEVHGKPLLQRVLENCHISGANFIVVLTREEASKYHTDQVVNLLLPQAKVILSPVPTSGAACTALLAVEYINNNEPLLIVNGDQILSVDHSAMVRDFIANSWDGGIPVFEDVHPKYSFVKVDKDGKVIEAAEKRPISRLATAGRYYFKEGKLFVRSAETMILKDAQTDGLFYVCPSYNEAILTGAKIGVKKLERELYHNLGTPQGVQEFHEDYHPTKK